jgi:nucleotide-binding universal stress UspA family protein
MYKKILVPLDGSKRAEMILRHVEELAHCYKSKVIFFRVFRSPMVTGFDATELEMFHKNLEDQMNEAQRYVDALAGEFRDKGIASSSKVALGPVVKEILNIAERENVDLIAMCSHGRGGVSRLFYGSVASGVLNRADRPLLVIRSHDDM